MFGSGILEVAIGIVFIYLLVSLLCSAVREGIEAWTKTRAAYLEYGIRELLHDKQGSGIVDSFFNHPLIHGLYSDGYVAGRADPRPGLLARGRNLPSYIPARNFALALMDMAARGTKTDAASSDPGTTVLSLAAVRANVLNLKNAAVQRVLLTAIDSAQGDLNTARENIEAWYDSGMERVAGWYKRSTQWVIFWIALIIVIAGNFNTITIAAYLYRNDAARAAIVERAQLAVADPGFLERSYAQTKEALAALQLPIGWSNGWRTQAGDAPQVFAIWDDVLLPILGWLLTALAATLGAPFWFDLLKRVMVVRATVKPSNESP